MSDLPDLKTFCQLRDWYGLKDISERMPGLEAREAETRREKDSLRREVLWYKTRRERVPQHMEDTYNEAAWAWQRAHGACTLARREYDRLLREHPDWGTL